MNIFVEKMNKGQTAICLTSEVMLQRKENIKSNNAKFQFWSHFRETNSNFCQCVINFTPQMY